MQKGKSKGWAIAAGSVVLSVAGRAAPLSDEPPLNLLFILIDDLGWKDLNCYGGEVFHTPHIDRLASEGMLFTDAYTAASVCMPTRASLVTGKYPGRLHATALVNHHRQLGNVEKNPTGIKLIQPEVHHGVQLTEYTLPLAFRDAGYRTALFGKTHFGTGRENLYEMGFDEDKEPPCDMWITPPAVVPSDPKRMTTITDLSIDFMRESVAENRPFFLYVSHNAVHVQVQATRKYYDQTEQRLSGGEKEIYDIHYVAMVEELDREVGRLMSELETLGIQDTTAVVFTSDNGGVEQVVTRDPYRLTSMDPLRGQKGGQYEGGHRVPLIVRWPGRTEPGAVSDVVNITPDLYPTFLEMAGLPLRPEQHLDGISLVPALKGSGPMVRDTIYWHKPHYYVQSPPVSFLRHGTYKYYLYWETELSPYGGRPHELFNLEDDIGETNNLVMEKPEVAAHLHAKLLRHVEQTGCAIPEVNPKYEPRPHEREAPPLQ